MTTEMREAAAARSDDEVHVTICPAGDHLRVVSRWESRCGRCGQSIKSGNVGPDTWDDEAGCNQGHYSFQHGCGELNLPIEVTILDPGDYPSLEDLIDSAIAELKSDIAQERSEARDKLARTLREDLTAALARLRDGADPEDVTTGDDFEPGVYRPNGEWVAWAVDPTVEGDTIDVTERGLAAASEA